MWMLGLAILGLGVVAGSIAWMIGRSISRPLGQLGARMQALADGSLEGDIPGIGRGDEIGEMAATVQIFKDNALRISGLEKAEAETQERAAAERRAAMEEPRRRFRAQRQRHRPLGVDRCGGHADHGAIDDGHRQRRQLTRGNGRSGVRKCLEQRRDGRGRRGRAVELGRRNFPSGDALQRDRQQGGRRCRTYQRHRRRAVDRRREDRRSRQTDPFDRRPDQSAGAQRHHRGGARRRIRPRLCGRRLRGQGAGQPDRKGHRGNLGPGRRHAGIDQRCGRLDRRHHRRPSPR